MANVGISARLTADASPFEATLRTTEASARAWGQRMARTTSGAAAGLGGAGAGGAILELSRGIEDLQYGIRGVLNNIPTLIQQLGGSAGLAGALSLAAVAAFQLGRQLRAYFNAAKEAGLEAIKINEEMADTMQAAHERELAAAQSGTKGGREALKKSIDDANKAMELGSATIERDAEGLRKINDLLRARKAAADDFAASTARAHAAAAAELATAREGGNLGRIRAAQIAEAEAAADKVAAQREAQRVNEETNAAILKNAEQRGRLEKTEAERKENERQKELEHWNKEADALRKRNLAEAEALSQQYDRVIQLQRAYDKEAEALKRINEEHQKNLGHLETEARIKKLREQGRDVAANKLEHEQNVNDRAEQIQRDTGVSPERARELAEDLEGREGKRINAKSRRHIKAGGIDAFRDLPPIGGPTRNQSRSSRSTEQVQETPKAGDIASLLKKQGETLTEIAANTAGLAKGKSEPLRRTA